MNHDKIIPPSLSPVQRFAKSWKSAALTVVIGVALMLILPSMLDEFSLVQVTVYVVMSILGISLGFIWGSGGILCFGQSAFFGIGAYTYAVAVANTGESTGPLLLSILVPAAFALVLGYVIFYGRLSDVYMGVITLTVTLILFNVMNSTAGHEWDIGQASLGGFNGIPGIATLNMLGNPDDVLGPKGLFTLSMLSLILVYVFLRWLLASKIGKVIVACRENEQRTLLLGYDSRAYKLLAFVIGAAIAGLSGCLFANWGAFTSPTVFSLAQSAQIIIWVIVGGLETLVGPIVGCLLIQWMTTQIGTQQTLNANLLLGAILVAFVLLVPKGIVPSLGSLGQWFASRLSRPKKVEPLQGKSATAKDHEPVRAEAEPL
jgi:ABC-type branched-subunit amino acid transport system permease subunit